MLPALRRPKFMETKNFTKNLNTKVFADQYVILTLKDEKKLVISSDAYNGILKLEEMFKCLFCGFEMELNDEVKELHKNSAKHKNSMDSFPYIEEFCNNLVRKLNRESAYCTICNVIVTSPFLSRHITSDVHIEELEKASARAADYKPCIN